MKKLTLRFCQIYILVALLATTALSAPPYSILTLALLLATLLIIWRSFPARYSIFANVATIFLLPLALEPLLSYLTYTTGAQLLIIRILEIIAILPVIYLLDFSLRQNTQHVLTTFTGENPKGRYITNTARTLLAAPFAMLLVSLILDNLTLLFTAVMFALYLLATFIRVFLVIPRAPLEVSTLRKRIIAGDTTDISLYVTSKSSVELISLFNPADPWVKVKPQKATLNRGKVEINLSITPPLAGSSRPQLQTSATDTRGLIQINQLLEPADLHVIPRAKYAEWLALKYLEQAGGWAEATVPSIPKTLPVTKWGKEYFASRNYLPGDPLKNIDWKHTLKLNELIVKEYIEAGGQAAVLAVNLSVNNAEEADKIALNLITTALTFAQESIPTALAVYNHQRVILTTAVIDPREVLKQTFSLVKDITTVEIPRHLLQLPDLGKLKRNISQLKQATSEPAQRLLSLLNFEYQATEKAAINHPATLALSQATERIPPPATVVFISQWNHDAEALLVITEKLSRRAFTTIPLRN